MWIPGLKGLKQVLLIKQGATGLVEQMAMNDFNEQLSIDN